MADDCSILRSPKEHFTRAAELGERSKFLAIRAKELQITNASAAFQVGCAAALDAQFAIYHLAKAFEALALLKQLGISS